MAGRRSFSATDLPLGAGGVGLCGGCQALKRCRLGVTSIELGDDGVLRVAVTCPPEREGLPGVAHGGWTADLFDDVLGRRLSLAGMFRVTRVLTVEYVRPVPIGRPLFLTAHLVSPTPAAHRSTAPSSWARRLSAGDGDSHAHDPGPGPSSSPFSGLAHGRGRRGFTAAELKSPRSGPVTRSEVPIRPTGPSDTGSPVRPPAGSAPPGVTVLSAPPSWTVTFVSGSPAPVTAAGSRPRALRPRHHRRPAWVR